MSFLVYVGFVGVVGTSRRLSRLSANLLPLRWTGISPTMRADGIGIGRQSSRDPNLNPAVSKVRQLIGSAPNDGWEKCWDEGLTPWDLGQATPIITQLVQAGKLPKGRVLIPGCGMGYDVVAMATPERFAVGLDISSTAINRAKEWSSSLPNARFFTFLAEDFFTWTTTELFDVVFDYTFFCAIHPTLRQGWARKVSEFLKPDGELITLMFLLEDQEGGPPYSASVSDYIEVLLPVGFQAISIEDNEVAVGGRKGAEKLGRWKRSSNLSAL